MPAKSPDNGLGCMNEPLNYCLQCWKEITTLTEEERPVFKYLKMKMHKTKKTFDYYEE